MVTPADIDEEPRPGERPIPYVERLAREKADAVDGPIVVAADTTVDLDGVILGKPSDGADAHEMLRRLSGRTHRVHTGVAVRNGDAVTSAVETTEVEMITMSDTDLEWYVATGEPFDKAGAYGLQGSGGAFVSAIRGCASNVIGLPLPTTIRLMRDVGLDPMGHP